MANVKVTFNARDTHVVEEVAQEQGVKVDVTERRTEENVFRSAAVLSGEDSAINQVAQSAPVRVQR